MKTNLPMVNMVLAMIAALISAAIPVWLAGEANGRKFAAWAIFFAALQSWMVLPKNAAGRWCAVKLPRLWKRD